MIAQTITLIVDGSTGQAVLEGPDSLAPATLQTLGGLLGPGEELGCARPLTLQQFPVANRQSQATVHHLRVAGYYHGSLVEGPGRRSCALLQGCTLGCLGCWVPQLHDVHGGMRVPVDELADALLDPTYERDGVSLLGGEVFGQAEGLLALVEALRARGCPHILCYSGYTYEALRRQVMRRPAIGEVLDRINMLIDGPFVARQSHRAGPWTGSGNQRVLTLHQGLPIPYVEHASG